MTMFVALNSIGLELLSIDKEMHPRLSSGLMFILFGVLLSTYSFPRYFKIGFATRSDFGKIIGMIIVPIIVINLAIQLINSLGYFGSSSAGVFYYGLLVMLMAAAVQFMTIILDREVLGIEK